MSKLEMCNKCCKYKSYLHEDGSCEECKNTKKQNIDYDEMLDKWHDKVIEKADKYQNKADEYEFGSIDYFKYRSYSDALYMALSMLTLEERKAKRKLRV